MSEEQYWIGDPGLIGETWIGKTQYL